MLKVKPILASLLAATTLLMVPMATAAQDAAAEAAALKALDDALPGTLLHNPFDMKWNKSGNDIKTKVVDADALSTGKAVSARVKKKQPVPWGSSVNFQVPDAVSKGDEIQVYFYVRTKKPAAGKDTGDISMFVGRNEPPFDFIMVEEILPPTEWELMSATAVAEKDYSAGKIKVEYQLGKAAQTIEIGPVYVSSLGPKALD